MTPMMPLVQLDLFLDPHSRHYRLADLPVSGSLGLVSYRESPPETCLTHMGFQINPLNKWLKLHFLEHSFEVRRYH